ncbi:MAG: BamA/TamA family outer membrane protein, partial [Selenomonadaceae bacterium]|nr:BamA/TamA family outer membrane protein [Selenomonadaceae bacterium]
WLDRKETALTLRLYNRSYDYNDYDTDGDLKEEYMRKYSGGEITLSRPISEYSTNYLTLRNRKDSYEKHLESGNAGDRSTEAGDAWREANFGTTRSITFQHVTDTRDNIYEPTEGGRVSLTAEIGGFGGDFSFRKASIEDQRYYKVGHSQVVATRLAYGIGSGDISEFNQFKVGGQDTLRGYRDDQFRGNRMFMGTLEYRFPLVSKVQGAIFTDWGSAWDGGFKPKDLHGSVGIGLALNTPLGPLRLDYGRRSGGGRVHFSVGGTF